MLWAVCPAVRFLSAEKSAGLVARGRRGGRSGRIVAGPSRTVRRPAGPPEPSTTRCPRRSGRSTGLRRADGGLTRKPSPQDWAWLAHLGEQLERLPDDWDEILSDDDPLTTLVVEITASLAEAGLSVHDADRPGRRDRRCLPDPRAGAGRHRRHLAPARPDERRPGARRHHGRCGAARHEPRGGRRALRARLPRRCLRRGQRSRRPRGKSPRLIPQPQHVRGQ